MVLKCTHFLQTFKMVRRRKQTEVIHEDEGCGLPLSMKCTEYSNTSSRSLEDHPTYPDTWLVKRGKKPDP